ncbi:hypothetical protein AKG34_06570 [Peribacillus butanolivorans]|uniref:hypothetical protein n=1 Tax=Peribacillus butanolivorans TaxID=421767 RepID=UPI0006A6B05E|nr:hypothetical protein [Peribacillus butanolivorans]KON68510.1 hypothetical protein AKG34_06570 [Peribacillus butanolivorans]
MLVIFMFLLFLLNMLTIFAVVVLYLRQNRLTKLEKDQKAIISEMEELLSGYLMEMKEDNETLVKTFTNSVALKPKGEHEEQERAVVKNSTRDNEIKREKKMLPDYKEGRHMGTKKQAAEAYNKKPEDNEEHRFPLKSEDRLDLSSEAPSLSNQEYEKEFSGMLQVGLNELSLNEQVEYLADQGHSIEKIAKKLNRGKTEIELLLKFHMNR